MGKQTQVISKYALRIFFLVGIVFFVTASAIASISYTPSSPNVGETVTFTVTPPSGYIVGSIEWDFGDGTTEIHSPPDAQHTYGAPGTYSVKATYEYEVGGKVFKRTDTTSITVAQVPIPSISYSPSSPQAGQTITFTANNFSSTSCIKWDFGDGTITNDTSPPSITHMYINPGSYMVKAYDNCGAEVTATTTVSVGGAERYISYTPPDPRINEEVTFKANNFFSSQIKWDFGDGTIVQQGSPVEIHIYKKEGSYTVTAYDRCGDDKFPKSITLKVLPRRGPAAPFSISFIQLRFEDGKTYKQVPKDFIPLVAFADIKSEGTGILEAEWLVDGKRFQRISKSLPFAKPKTISSGKATYLPTRMPGMHEVTLNIIQPQVDFKIPSIRYFISLEKVEKKVQLSLSEVRDLGGKIVPVEKDRISLTPDKHYILSGAILNLSEEEIPSLLLEVSLADKVVDRQMVRDLKPREKRSFETSILSDVTQEKKLSFKVFDTSLKGKVLGMRELRIVRALPHPELMREITEQEKLRPLAVGMQVLKPNGGESWYKGAHYWIRWESSGTIDTVSIDLLKEGARVLRIAPSTENDGWFGWVVPDDLEEGSDYIIRIFDIHGISDASDWNFSILYTETPEIRVNLPNGGETWYKGMRHEVRWWSRGVGDRVHVDLYLASGPREGMATDTIAFYTHNREYAYSGYYSTGSCWYTVPDDISLYYTYKVRVTGTCGPTYDLSDVYDESDAPFHIEGPLPGEVTLPMVETESGCVYRQDPMHEGDCCGELEYALPKAGAIPWGVCLRGLASFDISGIPRGAIIESAILDLSQHWVFGTLFDAGGTPFTDLAAFEVYEVHYSIPPRDYCRAFSTPGMCFYSGALPDDPIDVTPLIVHAHRRDWSRWQIRMQFQIQSRFAGEEEGVCFREGDRGCVLRITYS